jgi:hypothetical protein
MGKGACCTYQEMLFSEVWAWIRRGQDAAYSSSNFVMDIFMTAKLGDMAGEPEFSYGNVPGHFVA